MFHGLEAQHIESIARIQLRRLGERLERQEMRLEVTEAALAELARSGFDPVFGARPLKRAIQQQIENPVARLILEGQFGPRDVVPVDWRDGQFVFSTLRAGRARQEPAARETAARAAGFAAQAAGRPARRGFSRGFSIRQRGLRGVRVVLTLGLHLPAQRLQRPQRHGQPRRVSSSRSRPMRPVRLGGRSSRSVRAWASRNVLAAIQAALVACSDSSASFSTMDWSSRSTRSEASDSRSAMLSSRPASAQARRSARGAPPAAEEGGGRGRVGGQRGGSFVWRVHSIPCDGPVQAAIEAVAQQAAELGGRRGQHVVV